MGFYKAGAKLVCICCAMLLLFGLSPTISYAEEGNTVWDALNKPSSGQADNKGGQSSPADSARLPGTNAPSGWMFVLQVIFSLGLVIVLIYLLLRFLANRQIGLGQNGPFKVLGAISLGNGKSLQAVMIGDSLYILGVGENIQLVRHIPAGEEMDVILADVEMKSSAAVSVGEWFASLRQKKRQQPFIQTKETGDSFEELLAKQWEQVTQQNEGSWEEQNQHRGERL
jgi:flagellar protein FliO/FliZ